MSNEDYLERLRSRLGTPELSDASFDGALPLLARTRSSQFWSPLSVVNRAVELFRERGCKRILDVGSGPGKFCIAGAFAEPALAFTGVEQRVALVNTANELKKCLRAQNAEFRVGDALDMSWREFDGFYFFNPFIENRTGHEPTFDKPGPARARFRTELVRLAECLSRVRVGALLITYHGIGGPIPSSYDPIAEERVGTGWLRVWQKKRSVEQGFLYLEHDGGAERLSHERFERLVSVDVRRSGHVLDER